MASYYWTIGYQDGETNSPIAYNFYGFTQDQQKLYAKGYRVGVRAQDKKKRKEWDTNDHVLVPESN